jgi:hypothetical protein
MHIYPLREFVVNAAAIARQVFLAGLFLVTFLASLAVEGRAQTAGAAPDTSLTREQLEQLVAPIALYPDSLLAQVLMASTYPLEIVQAARWADTNSKLKGKALEDALQPQAWDPSVKSIVVVPQVLRMLSDKLDWTQMLGNAFLAQQDDLLKAVQDLRARADAKGTLKTTSQQKVSKQSVTATPDAGIAGAAATTAIVIEPTDPQVMYVPTYDPGVVYGAWPYPSYPPYSWYPPGYVAGNLVSFGVGVAVGAAIWGNCNWGRGQVNVNVNNFNSFNRTNIANGSWQHSVDHRKGVPYANSNVAERFGQKGAGAASAARDQFRGRAESGQLGNQGLQNRPGGQIPGQSAGNRAPGAGQGARPAQTPGQGAAKKTAAGGAKNAASAKSTKNAAGSAAKNRPAAGPGASASAGVKALDGVGRGQSVRQESARGAASRDAMASARPAASAARPSPGGGGGGARAGGGGGGARGGGGGGRRSDIRLKHDVILLGRLDGGLGFYRFSYNGSDKAYVGVIAQEVQAVMPQAVARDRDGYLRVFYDKLGLRFQTYDRWIASGAHVPPAVATLH